MTSTTPAEIIAILCEALQSGDNHKFIDQFAENSVFEQPFTTRDGMRQIEGLAGIREAYGKSNPLRQRIEIDRVHTNVYESKDDTCTVEFFIEGKNAGSESFSLMSSIAVIRFENGKIVNYRDYPNAIGFAKAVGALPQLIASLGG